MHDSEKSDSAIVAVKPPNKAGLPVAEAVEPRAGTKGNADQQSTYRTQSRKRVIQALSRVRQTTASPSNTQGRSRMLELGSSGSVRGVSSNGHPDRDPRWRAVTRRCLSEQRSRAESGHVRRTVFSHSRPSFTSRDQLQPCVPCFPRASLSGPHIGRAIVVGGSQIGSTLSGAPINKDGRKPK